MTVSGSAQRDDRRYRLKRPVRIGMAVFFFCGVAGGGVWGAAAYVRHAPPTLTFTAGHPGGVVNMTIQTVGQMGHGRGHSEPLWVSYLTRASNGTWVHTTQWNLPAHTRVNVTDYEYDSGSPLRNEYWGVIKGIVPGSYRVELNGTHSFKTVHQVVNSYAGNGVAHTFSVPTLGINVPLYGLNGDLNLCSLAPCTTKSPHNIVKFSFYTPGVGQYRWQCFIPCGVGYLNGNGGPMDTLGYMAGFLKVVQS